MKCEEFQRRLDRSLDKRLDPDSDWALISHAGDCESCRHDLRDQQTLDEAMSLFHPPELPGSFAANVVALAKGGDGSLPRPADSRDARGRCESGRCESGRCESGRFVSGRLWFVGVSVAAVLLLGCTFLAFLSSPARDHSIARTSLLARISRVPRGKQTRQAPPSKLAFSKSELPRHEGNAQDVGVQASPKPHGLISAFVPLTSLPSIESDEIPGVRPLVTSFDVTISLLKRTIPRHANPSRKRPSTSLISLSQQHVV